MDLGLKGKTALVTGSSAGLGLAAARALAGEGARVAICSRDHQRIDVAAKSLSSQPGMVFPTVCDLEKAEDIKRMLEKVSATLGPLDILVTNCGGPPTGTHESTDEDKWEIGYGRTFMSTIRLIQGVIPEMKARHFGRIILITSISAKQPIDNLLLSNAYRAGLLGYAKSISRELAPFGITVNSVLPGYTLTERLQFLANDLASKSGRLPDAIIGEWVQTVPTGRLGRPEELAALIAFLSSTQAGYITGTATAVDGGRTQGIV